jgi:glycosyltransferase involved in cell wall biosynthesis
MNQNKKQKISVIIPVYNEADSIEKVLKDIPQSLVHEVVIVDNGSSDQSSEIAERCGATVLKEPRKGYGAACLKGIAYLKEKNATDILVFLDGDYSDYPEEMESLINKINEGYDFVLGSRILGVKQYNAMLQPHSIFGNKVAAFMLTWLFGGNYTDLGPFRAIKFDKLVQLNMSDPNYGWTMEMQIKALRHKLKVVEIAVHYRERYGGISKVTGSLAGSLKALLKITYVVILYFLRIK